MHDATNEIAAFPGFDKLETPEVLLTPALKRNIQGMQALAERAGLQLWPHIKTHKCLEIARMQLKAGATGLTASKVDEALVFLQAGLGPLLLAYPIVDAAKARKLLTGAGDTPLRCIVDSPRGVEVLDEAATSRDIELPVYIKVDVGLHRCGVAPQGDALPDLARRIRQAGHLRFAGLLSHAGHAYAATDGAGVRAIAEEERTLTLAARERLVTAGLANAEDCRLSVGSTPTVLAAPDFSGLQELRPGNYVFLDRTPLRLGLAREQDAALLVLASVVSKNRDFLIIDAGSKTLGLDKAPHGVTPPEAAAPGGEYGHGLLRWPGMPREVTTPRIVSRLSEEHGFVPRKDAPDFDPPLGARVLITPNHSCVVANLATRLALLSPDAEPRFLPVDARARVR